jgi:hypothetical protein
MGGPGQLEVGRPITPATGSAQVVLPRSGQLLGFYASVTGTMVLYDANQTTALPAAMATIAATVVGWNTLPIDFAVGLVANVSAATIFIIS